MTSDPFHFYRQRLMEVRLWLGDTPKHRGEPMNFPPDIESALREYWNSSEVPNDWSGVRMVVVRAIELLRANGGTMTVERIDLIIKTLPLNDDDRDLRQHITAQGAKAAEEQARADTLHRSWQRAEQENTALREKVAALEGECTQRASDWRRCLDLKTKAEGERDALRAELAQRNEELWAKTSGQVAEMETRLRHTLNARGAAPATHDALSRLAALAQQGHETRRRAIAEAVVAVSSLAEDVVYGRSHVAGLNAGQACAWLSRETCARLRWTQSTDEARTLLASAEAKAAPGDGASEMHMPMADGFTPFEHCQRGTCGHDDVKSQGHAERVAERSQAFNEAVKEPDVHPEMSPTEYDAYERGAEAMRAACIEAVLQVVDEEGLDHALRERLKAAIEGATP